MEIKQKRKLKSTKGLYNIQTLWVPSEFLKEPLLGKGSGNMGPLHNDEKGTHSVCTLGGRQTILVGHLKPHQDGLTAQLEDEVDSHEESWGDV